MNILPYDVEMLLIGTSLRYGNDVVKLVLPKLTPDRFIYSKTGKLGYQDHRNIWGAIEKTFLVDKLSVNIPNVLSNLHDKSDDTRLYLQALAGMVVDRFHIYEIDIETIKNWAEAIDKAGGVYSVKIAASKLSENLLDQNKFEQEITQIDDVDIWANASLSAFKNTIKPSTGGLQHVSVAVANIKETMRQQRSGEQTTFLPCGMPSLIGAGMFAAGNLSVVHGMSGSGKSAFVHQANLGVAIGLVKYNIQGCVAIFSLEMSQERLTKRLAGLLAGVDVTFLDKSPEEDPLYDFKYSQLDQWLDYVGALPIYIDQTNMLTTSAMQYCTEGLHVSEFGPVRAASMDYLELFEDSTGDSKEQRLDHVIHEHLALARYTGANVTAISQTTYAGGGATIYPAGPGGTRYSQAIRHAADDIYELWSPIYMKGAGIKYAQLDGISEQHVTIFTQKCRYGALGATRLNWEPTCTRFSDPQISSDLVFDHFKDNKQAEVKTAVRLAEEDEF